LDSRYSIRSGGRATVRDFLRNVLDISSKCFKLIINILKHIALISCNLHEGEPQYERSTPTRGRSERPQSGYQKYGFCRGAVLNAEDSEKQRNRTRTSDLGIRLDRRPQLQKIACLYRSILSVTKRRKYAQTGFGRGRGSAYTRVGDRKGTVGDMFPFGYSGMKEAAA
jgi:hypothetical protein